MKRIIVGCLLFACWSVTAVAQDADPWLRLKARVISVGEDGRFVIDRGTRDRVEKGDFVFLYPREGGNYRADVLDVTERSATAELRDKKYRPVAGMRGEVVYRKARLKPATPKKPDAGAKADKPTTEPKKPAFKNKDDKWKPGMPLLATPEPVRPEQREPNFFGRAYAMGDLTRQKGQGFSNSFIRAGADMTYENPMGHGGTFRLNAEANYKKEFNGKSGPDILIRRLSYRWGGTRFIQARWEAGRFLQHAVPEFGYLDGVEWNRRMDQHRFGVSAGLMPEPTEDFDTGSDFQVGAFYEWAADIREQLTFGIAAQKTFHHSKSDRDLVVMKFRYYPDSGWNARGTIWVDFYTGKDRFKDAFMEVTQAFLSAGRDLANGGHVEFSFSRRRFPQLLRDEFVPIAFDKLDNNQYDRLAFDAWTPLGKSTRLQGHLSGWNDEDDEGASVDVGLQFDDALMKDGRLQLSAFGTLADFVSSAGGRVSLGQYHGATHWNVLYDFGHHHAVGFPDDRNDLIQHRVRVSTGMQLSSSVDLSLHGEVRFWDDDISWTTGFFIQKSF